MKCKFCNAELAEDQKFCTYCGNKVEAEVTPVEEAPVEAVVEEVPATTVPVAVETPAPVAQPIPTPVVKTAVPKEGKEENQTASKSAIIGFILGIASFVVCCLGLPLGIIGIILSVRGLKSTKKGFAIPGIILSALGIVDGISVWLGFAIGFLESFFNM